jgi:predicted ferric reductase
MFRQATNRPDQPITATPHRRTIWPWLVIAAAVLAVLALAGPPLLPAMVGSLAGTTPQAYWYISRACAFVAFGLVWLSMLAGLGITTQLASRWPSLPGSFELHRFTALLGLGFAVIHALVLLGDQYIGYNLGQILVPFLGSTYRPAWVGFGQVAIYLLGVVAFSFYVKDRLGIYAWRLIHMLSFALFLMTVAHGLGSGTDSSSLWAQALYWGSAISVLGLSVYRIVAVRRKRAKAALAGSGLIAAGGKTPAPLLGSASAIRGRATVGGLVLPRRAASAVPMHRPNLQG